jgi:hypothetical protein
VSWFSKSQTAFLFLWERHTFGKLDFLLFVLIHRHIGGFALDRMRAEEIECKLVQAIGFKGSGGCTCYRESTPNTRCEVKLIDADTFVVGLWTIILPSPRQGMHMADNLHSLPQEERRRSLEFRETGGCKIIDDGQCNVHTRTGGVCSLVSARMKQPRF